MCTNERRWLRYPPLERAATQLRDARFTYAATIVDESLGGLRVTCPDAPPWASGDLVNVLYWGRWEPAVVRWTEWRDDQEVFGLEWRQPPACACAEYISSQASNPEASRQAAGD